MATEEKSSGKNHPRRRALSVYLRGLLDELGETPHSFSLRYGLPQRTLASLIGCENDPTARTIARLSAALTEALGREITPAMLLAAQEADAPEMHLIDTDNPNTLIKSYLNLSHQKQVAIAPELIRVATEALELATAQTRQKIAILTKRERTKSGKSTDQFAEKHGLNGDLVYALQFGGAIAPTFGDIRKLAESIRDFDGKYGNLELFVRLIPGSPVRLRQIVNDFMSEKGLKTPTALAGILLKENGMSPDPEVRKRVIRGLEKILSQEKQLSLWDAELIDVLPLLATSLGFEGDVESLIRACSED